MNMPTQHAYVKIAPTMNLALRREAVLEAGGFDETLVRCEDIELTYKVTQRHKILYEPEAVVWFRGSPTLRKASRKCIRHFIGAGQLIAKHGFNPFFARLNLPIRGIILIAAVASIFFMPRYVPMALFAWLFTEFVYKTMKMYWRYHDRSVVYYVVFFTFWSLVSLTIFYGLYRGLKNKRKERVQDRTSFYPKSWIVAISTTAPRRRSAAHAAMDMQVFLASAFNDRR